MNSRKIRAITRFINWPSGKSKLFSDWTAAKDRKTSSAVFTGLITYCVSMATSSLDTVAAVQPRQFTPPSQHKGWEITHTHTHTAASQVI